MMRKDETSSQKAEQPLLVIVMGAVATGKTRLRREKYSKGFTSIDAGEIFIQLSEGEYYDFPSHLETKMDEIGRNKMRECVQKRENIVVEIAGVDYELVKEMIDQAEKINYTVQLDYVECDINLAWEQNIGRGDDNISALFNEKYHYKWFREAVKKVSASSFNNLQIISKIET